MKMRRSIVFFLALCSLTSGQLFSQCPILPTPEVYIQYTEYMELEQSLTINDNTLPQNIRLYLEQELWSRFEIKLKTKRSGAELSFLNVFSSNEADPKLYQIHITDKILLQSTTDEGMFYAVNSFLQLIQGEKGHWKIQCCIVKDQPKFSWRGLHLDVSRHFFTVDEVKRYIDLMALYKYNTFHWHLTDDQGWRIEIKKYPKLTEIGAWRDSTVNKHYSTNPRTYTVERYGGFYTQEQIKDVVKYAQDRYITVVPEIEMPGHSRAALAAYPQYSCTGKLQEVPGLWGIFEDIYCSKKESIQFLQDILAEVIELFPGKYIHIGGDEAPKDRWKVCPACQAVITANGLKDEHELQSYFIRQMDEFLTTKGKQLIGWDEILEGGLSPNAAVMSWRGIAGGIEAASQGHDVVMTPGSHCYFDHYQSDNPGEPLAIGGYTPLEKVYQYEPVPKDLELTKHKHILGAQANLWTEYIPDMQQLEYMTYPRAIALAQVLWCTEKPEYAVFWDCLVKHHLSLLTVKKVNFSKALFATKLEVNRHEKGLELLFISPHPDSEPSRQILERDLTEEPRSRRINIHSSGVTYPIPDSEFTLLKHSAIGLPVNYQTQPNSHYSHNKEVALVDGIKGRRPWNGKEWMGFDTSRISVTIDLLQSSEVKTVTIGLLDDNGAWIYLPERIFVSVSDDNINWNIVQEQDIKEETKLLLNQKGRYVKVEMESLTKIPEGKPGAGQNPWTFVDEILIDYRHQK